MNLKPVQGQRPLPYEIAINSKGVPFFCEFGTNKMAKIDPQTMAITEFKLPEGARPRRMAIDAQDKIYFTDYEGGNLGRLDPATGAVKMWPTPSGKGAAPYGITITPDGAVWFTELSVGKLSRLRDGRVDEFRLPRAESRPFGVAVDAKNNVWYTDLSGWLGMLPAVQAKAP